MNVRGHGGAPHVHACSRHSEGCDFFLDHAPAWLVGNRHAVRYELLIARRSLVALITVLNAALAYVDTALEARTR